MSDINLELKEMLNTFEHLKTTVDELEKDKKENKGIGLATEKLEKIQDRLDELEAKSKTRTVGGSSNNAITDNLLPEFKNMNFTEEELLEHKKGFDNYIKTKTPFTSAISKKAMSTDFNPAGGYFVTPTLASNIIKDLKETSPMRKLATIVTLNESNEYAQPIEAEGDVGFGWVGERTERTETETSEIKIIKIPLHELYAEPMITSRILTDSSFDFENYLANAVVERFARAEETAFYTGDGINKPYGILTNPTQTGIETISANLSFDGLIDLVTSLETPYLNSNCAFQFNRLTLRAIRKLKDANGQYLWQPSQQIGMPSTILEYKYELATDIPAQTTGAYSVIFGDFQKAYTIADGIGMSMIRDEVTKKGFVKIYTSKRTGGNVTQAKAVKILQQT